jgi:serine phosphatase RsbU (regulator of sigma subunit)
MTEKRPHLFFTVVHAAALVAGLALALFCLVGLAENFLICQRQYFRSTFLGISIELPKGASYPHIGIVFHGSTAEAAGVRSGDSCLAVDGHDLHASRLLSDPLVQQLVKGKMELGRELTLSLERGGRRFTARIRVERIPLLAVAGPIMLGLLTPLVMLGFVLVGVWGLLRGPRTYEVLLIALLCFALGSLLFQPLSVGDPSGRFWTGPFYWIKNNVSLYMYVPLLWTLFFFRLIPRDRLPLRARQTAIGLLVLATLALLFLDAPLGVPAFWLYMGLLAALFAVTLVALGRGLRRETDMLRRRRYRLVRTGLLYGSVSLMTGWGAIMLFSVLRQTQVPVILALLTLGVLGLCGGLMIPFTFLNSHLGQRLLETEHALKKRLRYLLATAALFLVFLTVIFLVGRWLVSRLGLTDPSLIIVLSVLAAAFFAPVNRRLHLWLESRFFPERTRYREEARRFLKKLSGFADPEQLLAQIDAYVEQTLQVRPAIALALQAKRAAAIPFQEDAADSVLNRIRSGQGFFWDQLGEAVATGEDAVNGREIEWARDHHISLSLPMRSYGELVGVLNVGRKPGGEDFNGDDMDIFREVSDQTALALQNLHLQGEYLEKKRLDKELSLARRVQDQLLPQEIPQLAGLDVFGRMRPCYEVAGDYFDVIPLDEWRVVLALADVSGKGAGAAMLMANLQAGLHSALRFTDRLDDIALGLNNLVNRNTSAAQFITCFLALYDIRSGRLTYVNAGHNPPLIVGPTGRPARLLEGTGLILGALADMPYGSGAETMAAGDVLVIYTDGVEEANDPQGREFGRDRIRDTVAARRTEPAQAIVQALFAEVEAFAAGTPFADDATALIARVK